MKKVLSLVLAVMMAIGMTTVAFAAVDVLNPTDFTFDGGDIVRGKITSVTIDLPSNMYIDTDSAVVGDSIPLAGLAALTQTTPTTLGLTADVTNAVTEDTTLQIGNYLATQITVDVDVDAETALGAAKITFGLGGKKITLKLNVVKAKSTTDAGTKDKVPSNWKITGFSDIATANWDAKVASEIGIGEKKNELPITAEMFNWEYKEKGETIKVKGSDLGSDDAEVQGVKANATLTSSQLSNVGVRRVYQKGTANTIKSVELKDSKSLVEVKTVKYYAKTSATDVELKLALTFKSKTSDIIVANYAFEMKNAEESIEEGQSQAYSYGHYVLKAEDTVRNVEFEGDEDGLVYATKTVVKGQKYYFNVDSEVSSADAKIIDANPEVDSIYTVYAVNMGNATIQFKDLGSEFFVYDGDGKLLGTTKDKALPLASKYILTTAKVNFGGADEEPVEETPDVDAPPMGGGEVAPNNSYNPNTGL